MKVLREDAAELLRFFGKGTLTVEQAVTKVGASSSWAPMRRGRPSWEPSSTSNSLNRSPLS